MKIRKFKKIVFAFIGAICCLSSLFATEFALGSVYAICSDTTSKASYAIDAIAQSNNASFINYEFHFDNSEAKRLNSRNFFKDNYDIETESVMLVTSMYSHSKIDFTDVQAIYNDTTFEINSLSLMTNLTSCFDFKCILTKTTLPKRRIGISESLAKKILNKEGDSDITIEEITELSQKVLNVQIDGVNFECSIYCYYKHSSQSYFDRYLFGDFVVLHETEIVPSSYYYVLTAVSYHSQTKKILNKFIYPNDEFNISIINENLAYKEISSDVNSYINSIYIDHFILYIIAFLFIGVSLFTFFILLKIKNRYLYFICSLLLVDLIKLWVLKFISVPLITISFSNYYCYLVLIMFTILFIKKKYKNE